MYAFPRVVSLVFIAALSACTAAAERQVSVTGLGEVSAKPDSAAVSLMVQSVRRESAAAKADVDTRVNAFLQSLDALGFAEEDVTAGSLRTSPRYDYRNGEQTFTGYEASRLLSVEVDDLDDLNGLLDAALRDKIDSVNNIEYRVSDSSALEAKARELAIAHSKKQAAELAAAYGVELGPIVSINYRSQGVTPVFMDAGPVMQMARAEASSKGRYLPDEITFNDQIDVVFDLIVNH
jgi:uncharacterized protein